MPRFWVPIVVSVVLLFPTNGNAQVQRLPEPPPQVTAANADWQIRGEPIFFASNFYWPTGPDIFFDGAMMVRTGQYESIPLYVNPFLPAWSVIYVPVGGGILRPYVRRALEAGMVGSAGATPPHLMLRPLPPPIIAMAPDVAVGTTGTLAAPPAGTGDTGTSDRARPSRTTISIPPRGSKNGIWLTFNGARYYNAGPAVPFVPERFIPIGEYGGFPVYRDRLSNSNTIYVTAVKDGPLAPYRP